MARNVKLLSPCMKGIKMHGDGRQKKRIDDSHALGLSVSYSSRVMEVKYAIAQDVCKRYAEDGVVVPTNLRRNVFFTYDVNNLDGQSKGNSRRMNFTALQ